MQHIANQLRRVRQTGRVLLVVRRLAQLFTALAPLAVGLGLLDYALRMPGAMRLLIGLAVLAAAGAWLLIRIRWALRFWPSLAELALRAERLHPQLAGSLASAVEFSLQPGAYERPAATASMAQRAVQEMREKAHGVDIKRMINPGPTLRSGALALLALLALVSVAAASPRASATAAQRWFMPLGDTQWPKVNQVQALTDDRAVFAADGKLRLRAKVTRGWSEGLRMTIQYRVLDDEGQGQWQSVRVAAQRGGQDAHLYETVLDVPAPTARALMAGQRASAALEVRYAAGDDATPTQSLTIAARPEIVSVRVHAAPPAYALGLIADKHTALHEQGQRLASTSAYTGSTVTLSVAFNKPIPKAEALACVRDWRALIGQSAQAQLAGAGGLADGFTLTWVLEKTVTGSFVLTDAYGLRSTESDRLYRIQAIEDKPPAVTLLQPAIDASVLPGASVGLRAIAEDDIAMRSLRLEVLVPDRENTPEDATQTAVRELDQPGLLTTGRFESLTAQGVVALKPLGLLPGDEVLITAVGRDVYASGGVRHDPVRSETRRLRVITEQELADQIRRVLRGVRNTASSLERSQRLVAERTPDGQPAESEASQGDIGRRVAAQQDTLRAVQDRLERNAPHSLDGLEQLLKRAEGMLDLARQASDQAQQSLGEAAGQQQAADQAQQQAQAAAQAGQAEQAKQHKQAADQSRQQQAKAQAQAGQSQSQAREQLAELVAALDMGESVGEIESELASLRSDAERVAQDTRELLPKTVGQKPGGLSPELRQALQDAAARQQALAQRAQELVDKMRATADEIGENGQTPEQRATASTLSEAADIAQRQGLQENTEEAAKRLEQNQIADAAAQQQQAMSTLEQMLAEMGKQKQRRQEELTRLLQELAQKIQGLVDEQRDQLARAEQAAGGALGVLEQPQVALRRRTMLVEAQARQAPDTAGAGGALGQAVRDQAEAVKSIRVNDKQATLRTEAEALAHLQEALALINEQQQQAQQDQQRQERFALRQAYDDLAKRQEALSAILAQHERDQAYNRRDWRQINRLYGEALEDRSFDETQSAIRDQAKALQSQAGEAMVYQSLHRRIDQAAARAENRLSDRQIDGPLADAQRSVAQMLRAMADALDDTADQDKFEDDSENNPQPGGEGGQGEPPPLVPDLAQIKLLREMMIMLRNQTQALDDARGAIGEPQRQAALAEMAQTQRELKGLGEQLIEKLRQQMQPQEREPRNGSIETIRTR